MFCLITNFWNCDDNLIFITVSFTAFCPGKSSRARWQHWPISDGLGWWNQRLSNWRMDRLCIFTTFGRNSLAMLLPTSPVFDDIQTCCSVVFWRRLNCLDHDSSIRDFWNDCQSYWLDPNGLRKNPGKFRFDFTSLLAIFDSDLGRIFWFRRNQRCRHVFNGFLDVVSLDHVGKKCVQSCF